MRKCVIWIHLLTLTLPYGLANAEYLTIDQVRETVPERWTQTYETKWCTVDVDVQPTIPTVEKMPIVKVSLDYWCPDVSLFGAEWKSVLYEVAMPTFEVNRNNVYEHENTDTQTKQISPPYDEDTKYGRNTDLSLREILDVLRETMARVGDSPQDWHYEKLMGLNVNETIDKKTGIPLFPDIYTISMVQKLEGIPLFGHSLRGVEEPKVQEANVGAGGLWMRISTPDVFSIFGDRVKVAEILSDDVPLCDFAKVKAAIEKEIEAGHVRKIFDVDLGYALYNDPSSYGMKGPEFLKTVQMYAFPVWWVNCYFVDNARTELRDYAGMDVYERGTLEYLPLIVNAQTGEVMDPTDNRKGCGDFQGFISWEDVGGKNQ